MAFSFTMATLAPHGQRNFSFAMAARTYNLATPVQGNIYVYFESYQVMNQTVCELFCKSRVLPDEPLDCLASKSNTNINELVRHEQTISMKGYM